MGLFDFFWPCKTDSDTFGADVPFTTEPHPFDTIEVGTSTGTDLHDSFSDCDSSGSDSFGDNSYDIDTSSSDPYGSNSFGSDPFVSDGF